MVHDSIISTPFQEGQLAAMATPKSVRPAAACPYSLDTYEGRMWLSGFRKEVRDAQVWLEETLGLRR